MDDRLHPLGGDFDVVGVEVAGAFRVHPFAIVPIRQVEQQRLARGGGAHPLRGLVARGWRERRRDRPEQLRERGAERLLPRHFAQRFALGLHLTGAALALLLGLDGIDRLHRHPRHGDCRRGAVEHQVLRLRADAPHRPTERTGDFGDGGPLVAIHRPQRLLVLLRPRLFPSHNVPLVVKVSAARWPRCQRQRPRTTPAPPRREAATAWAGYWP